VRAVTAIAWLLTLLYPFAIWFGLGRWEPRWLAGLLLLVALARALGKREPFWWAAVAGAALLVVAAWLGNDALPLKLYPVIVNAVMLTLFGLSVRFPPTVVERLARLREPTLPAEAVPYLRRVTLVWCAFFVLNGSIAMATALWASDAAWALYNGLIAYLLMGALFAGEWLVRPRPQAADTHG
jgi:uncharacterized membrane protein